MRALGRRSRKGSGMLPVRPSKSSAEWPQIEAERVGSRGGSVAGLDFGRVPRRISTVSHFKLVYVFRSLIESCNVLSRLCRSRHSPSPATATRELSLLLLTSIYLLSLSALSRRNGRRKSPSASLSAPSLSPFCLLSDNAVRGPCPWSSRCSLSTQWPRRPPCRSSAPPCTAPSAAPAPAPRGSPGPSRRAHAGGRPPSCVRASAGSPFAR